MDDKKKSAFLDLMTSEHDRLSQKDPKEIAENFKKAFAALSINNRNKPFLNWLLLQAPVQLLPCSVETTAFVATDGNMYINPVFWSSIVEHHNREREKTILGTQDQMMSDLSYLVVHEIGHLMLRHPWSGTRIINEAAELYQQPNKQGLQYIANLSMDFVVNAGFCSPLFPDANLLKEEGVGTPESFERFLVQCIGTVPDKVKEMFEEPDLALWGWDDIFRVIVSNLTQEQLDKMSKLGNYLDFDLSGAGAKASQGQGMGAPGRGTDAPGQGTHGEIVPNEGTQRIREGGLSNSGTDGKDGLSQDGSIIEDKWKRIAAEAVAEARSMGTEAGNAVRMFEKDFEVKVPWESLIRKQLASYLGHSQVRQTWTRTSRKHPALAGTTRIGGKNLWLLADVSGSINGEELDTMVGIALSYLKRSGGTMRVVFWDTEVCGDYVLRSKNDLRRVESIGGGGGTLIYPALQHLLDNAQRGDGVCVCTDSAIADITNTSTAAAMKDLYARFGSIVWFHFGNKRDIKAVEEISGRYITPVVVNAQTRLVDKLVPQKGQAGAHL